MIRYNELNDDERRTIREIVGVTRLSEFYLEDNNYMLMSGKDLFEYIYLCDIKKVKDAVNLINSITEKTIKQNDINKTILEVLIENHRNVRKISNRVYLYHEV